MLSTPEEGAVVVLLVILFFILILISARPPAPLRIKMKIRIRNKIRKDPRDQFSDGSSGASATMRNHGPKPLVSSRQMSGARPISSTSS